MKSIVEVLTLYFLFSKQLIENNKYLTECTDYRQYHQYPWDTKWENFDENNGPSDGFG